LAAVDQGATILTGSGEENSERGTPQTAVEKTRATIDLVLTSLLPSPFAIAGEPNKATPTETKLPKKREHLHHLVCGWLLLNFFASTKTVLGSGTNRIQLIRKMRGERTASILCSAFTSECMYSWYILIWSLNWGVEIVPGLCIELENT
jgi:hypothetical protein